MQIKEYYNLKAPTDLEFSKPTILEQKLYCGII